MARAWDSLGLVSRSRQSHADPGRFEWFWLGADRHGRLARCDAWPAGAREAEAGLFPTWAVRAQVNTARSGSAVLARTILTLPRAYSRPPRLLSSARARGPALSDPAALAPYESAPGEDPMGADEGLALIELREPVEALPLARVQELADHSPLAWPRPTRDSAHHAWLWTSASLLRRVWHPLGVTRAWFRLAPSPAELGAFEYVFDAERGCYRCVGAPLGPLAHVGDLLPTRRLDCSEVDAEFGLDASFVVEEDRDFASLRDCMRRRRIGW